MALTIKTQVLPMNPYVTRWDPSLPIPFLKTHVRLWGLSLHCYPHSDGSSLFSSQFSPVTILHTKSTPFVYSAWSSLDEVWLVLIPALLWRRVPPRWQPAQRLLLGAHRAKGAMQCGDFFKIYEQNYRSGDVSPQGNIIPFLRSRSVP